MDYNLLQKKKITSSYCSNHICNIPGMVQERDENSNYLLMQIGRALLYKKG